jgi:hypothetical protein
MDGEDQYFKKKIFFTQKSPQGHMNFFWWIDEK